MNKLREIYGIRFENVERLTTENVNFAEKKNISVKIVKRSSKISLNKNVQATSQKMKPEFSIELRSYVGEVNRVVSFFPNLAKKTKVSGDLFIKKEHGEWYRKHNQAFILFQDSLIEVLGCTHSIDKYELHVISDARRGGLRTRLMKRKQVHEIL